MIWLGGRRFLWRRAPGGERLSRPFQQAVRCPGAAAPTPTARRRRAGAARAPFSRLAPPSSTALPPTAHPRGRGAPRRRVRRDGERVGAPSGRRTADGPPVEPRGAERAQRTPSPLRRRVVSLSPLLRTPPPGRPRAARRRRAPRADGAPSVRSLRIRLCASYCLERTLVLPSTRLTSWVYRPSPVSLNTSGGVARERRGSSFTLFPSFSRRACETTQTPRVTADTRDKLVTHADGHVRGTHTHISHRKARE